jgi:hypothetical protein
MARSSDRHANVQLEPDSVAATLATDPEVVPEDTVILIGIPAPSRADKFKLFRDLRMTRAVEGPREAIRASKDIPEGQVPLGLKCVAVWVAADTSLTHTYAGPGARASSLAAIIGPEVFVPIDVLLWPPASPFGTRPIGEPPDPRTIELGCKPDSRSPTGYSERIIAPGKGSYRVPCDPLEG